MSAAIVVNDLWDELREENRWLRRRLRYERHMYELLEDFRVNATDLLTECECGKTGGRFAEIFQEFERQLGYVTATHWVPDLDDDHHVMVTDDEHVFTDNEELVSDDKKEVEVVDITSDNEEVAETYEGIEMTPPMVTPVADYHMDSDTDEVTEEVVDKSVGSNDSWVTANDSLPIVGPSTEIPPPIIGGQLSAARVMAINIDDNTDPSVDDSTDKPMAEDVVTYLYANPETDVVIDVSVGDRPSIVTPKKLVTTSSATHRPQNLSFDVHTYGSIDDPLDKPIEDMIYTYLDIDMDTDVVIDVSAGDVPSTVTPKPVVTDSTATTHLPQNSTPDVRTYGSVDEEFNEPIDDDFNLGTVLGDISAADWMSTVAIEFPSTVSASTPKPQITGSATGSAIRLPRAPTPDGHHNDDNRCRKCNKSFTNRPSLDRHVTLIHTKYVANAQLLALAAKPYACHRCLYTTDRTAKLDKHLAAKHSAKFGPPPLTRVTPGTRRNNHRPLRVGHKFAPKPTMFRPPPLTPRPPVMATPRLVSRSLP